VAQITESTSKRLRPLAIRSFSASAVLILIAVAWWVGLLGPNLAAFAGGFGTLFMVVAVVCLAIGLYRQFSSERSSRFEAQSICRRGLQCSVRKRASLGRVAKKLSWGRTLIGSDSWTKCVEGE
jgi:hypothetical protein